jgi:hypothetical protein
MIASVDLPILSSILEQSPAWWNRIHPLHHAKVCPGSDDCEG